jgi:hypothetical protein
MTRTCCTLGALLLLAACGGVSEPAEGPTPTTTTISYSGAPVGGNMNGGSASVTVTRFTNDGAVATPIEVAPRTAWSALHDAYASLGIAAESDSAGMLARTARFVAPRRLAGQPLSALLNCGFTAMGSPIADTYRVSMQLQTVVRPRENASQLETRLSANAQEPSNGSSVECASTGALEVRLAHAVLLASGGR